MAVHDIKHISRSIRVHLEDLHVMMTEDQVSIDIQYYNDVTLALLNAESLIDIATKAHNKRTADHRKRYGKPNTNVD